MEITVKIDELNKINEQNKELKKQIESLKADKLTLAKNLVEAKLEIWNKLTLEEKQVNFKKELCRSCGWRCGKDTCDKFKELSEEQLLKPHLIEDKGWWGYSTCGEFEWD